MPTAYDLPDDYRARRRSRRTRSCSSPTATCGLAPTKSAGRRSATWKRHLTRAVADAGYELVRAHPYKDDEQHGFIGSQKEGMCVFAGIDPDAPLIVAEAVWQYSHHVLAGLITHRGPILTVANWSGTWPGWSACSTSTAR